MNTKLLKSVMTYNCDNITTLSEYLNISRQTLSLKIDGISEFKLCEIGLICERYHLSHNQMLAIFFNEVRFYESDGSGKNNGYKSSVCEGISPTWEAPFWVCG